MSSQINEIYLNKLFDDLTAERNAIQLEFKNDKELSKTNILTNKLTTINSLITSTIKLRNLIIKSKNDTLKHI